VPGFGVGLVGVGKAMRCVRKKKRVRKKRWPRRERHKQAIV
jgi:hypothetical protein